MASLGRIPQFTPPAVEFDKAVYWRQSSLQSHPLMTVMPPKHLLLCFDAFGTLFRPRAPVHEQYGLVARSLGLSGFTDDDIQQSFKSAFKQEAKRNPNYGKANGLNPEKWWTNIIKNTFQPLVGSDQKLPPDLVPQLLNRFWCKDGYTLYSDVIPLLRQLREMHRQEERHFVVGVITNSDDRVPAILSSLGMHVSPIRFGAEAEVQSSPRPDDTVDDIDFSVMSYDVGHEKPDSTIFQAAQEMLEARLQAMAVPEETQDPSQWRKIYIGDEYEKDVVGALSAGWHAVLIDRDGQSSRSRLDWLADKPPGNLYQVLESSPAVGFDSLARLAQWLPTA